MAFLDNSGDIILDAVLTDTGRFRLAKGDGTFKIAKFAFGDDEINYQLYRNSNNPLGAHPSGSAYYDLEILQTPSLEAFTNNTSMLKTKLVSFNKTNLLYMPVMKLNTKTGTGTDTNVTANQANGMFIVSVDEKTSTYLFNGNTDGTAFKGVINGQKTSITSNNIHIDQGLDTDEIPGIFPLDAELVENQFIIEIDNRLGKIVDPANGQLAKVAFIDDDSIASYYLSKGSDPQYIGNDFDTWYNQDDLDGEAQVNTAVNVILGPKGNYLRFSIMASVELQTSTNLFEKIGGPQYNFNGDATNPVRYIDSTARVTGATTGFRLDVPIRFIKKA
jgi:hypothetical protein